VNSILAKLGALFPRQILEAKMAVQMRQYLVSW
jgi:hypothetical protein